MQGRVFLGDARRSRRASMVFGARDRCDETAIRIRTVRDARYRYIHNFTPEVPVPRGEQLQGDEYPVWNLLKELHAAGKLTPAQEFLCQPQDAGRRSSTTSRRTRTRCNNLAASPEHAATLAQLRGDPGPVDRRNR